LLIAGPCSITDKTQAFKIARFVKKQGATCFRGGLYKGQNHPIVNGKPEYLGIGNDGLIILQKIQEEVGLPCVCDAQTIEQASNILISDIEYLMIGARNMDNLALLRSVRKLYDNFKCSRKIILKRGPSATIDEWIGAAEHLGGPDRVILCERGTVHFDRTPKTRWRLDFVGVAQVKTYYPNYKVLIDPSHGSGDRNLVYNLSKAGLSIADGLMVEVHYDPDSSPTDANQTIDFNEFKKVVTLYKETTNGRKYQNKH